MPTAPAPMRAAVTTIRLRRATRNRRAVASSSKTSPRMARGRGAAGLRPRRSEPTLLLSMSFKRQLDQAADQVAVGEPGVLPELRVPAHGSEPGACVHFVQ